MTVCINASHLPTALALTDYIFLAQFGSNKGSSLRDVHMRGFLASIRAYISRILGTDVETDPNAMHLSKLIQIYTLISVLGSGHVRKDV